MELPFSPPLPDLPDLPDLPALLPPAFCSFSFVAIAQSSAFSGCAGSRRRSSR